MFLRDVLEVFLEFVLGALDPEGGVGYDKEGYLQFRLVVGCDTVLHTKNTFPRATALKGILQVE